MSEYIPKEKITRTNAGINICDQYIWIFEYIRHTLGLINSPDQQQEETCEEVEAMAQTLKKLQFGAEEGKGEEINYQGLSIQLAPHECRHTFSFVVQNNVVGHC